MTRMAVLLKFFRVILLAAMLPAATAGGTTYVSTDVCADQIAVLLLAEDEIAGLSRWARIKDISAVADRAKDLPVLSPSAEAVLLSGADIVLTGGFGDVFGGRMLQKLEIPIIRIRGADTFDEMAAIIEEAARALGRTQKGQEETQRLLLRLKAAEERGGKQTNPLALYLRPDGGGAGAGTAVDSVFRAAHIRNQAALAGRTGWSAASLESIVLDPPEMVVASFFGSNARSDSHGRHPALIKALKAVPTIHAPGALWSCGGWPLIDAVEFMVDRKSLVSPHD